MKTIILNEKQMEILKEGMDRHSFISHVKDYLKQLFKNPIYAKPDSFLIANGLDGETLKKHLEDKNIIVKHTSIKNDGGKDMFHVRYSLSANDGDRLLRRLYAELFESNIIEFVNKYGPDRFGKLMDNAITLVEFKLEKLKKELDITTTDGKIEYLKRIAVIISKIESSIEKDIYIKKVKRI